MVFSVSSEDSFIELRIEKRGFSFFLFNAEDMSDSQIYGNPWINDCPSLLGTLELARLRMFRKLWSNTNGNLS